MVVMFVIGINLCNGYEMENPSKKTSFLKLEVSEFLGTEEAVKESGGYLTIGDFVNLAL